MKQSTANNSSERAQANATLTENTNTSPQAAEQLLAQCRDTVQTSSSFLLDRDRWEMEIEQANRVGKINRVARTLRNASALDSIYEKTVKSAAWAYFCFLTRYVVLLFAEARLGRDFAKRLCVAVVSSADALECNTVARFLSDSQGSNQGLHKNLLFELLHVQNDVRRAKKEFIRALNSFAHSPNTKAREFAVITFLRALYDAECAAREACRLYEYAEIMDRITVKILDFSALPLHEVDSYASRHRAVRYDIEPSAMRRHLPNALADEALERAIEGTFSAGAIEIFLDREITRSLDSYLRSQMRSDDTRFWLSRTSGLAKHRGTTK